MEPTVSRTAHGQRTEQGWLRRWTNRPTDCQAMCIRIHIFVHKRSASDFLRPLQTRHIKGIVDGQICHSRADAWVLTWSWACWLISWQTDPLSARLINSGDRSRFFPIPVCIICLSLSFSPWLFLSVCLFVYLYHSVWLSIRLSVCLLNCRLTLFSVYLLCRRASVSF